MQRGKPHQRFDGQQRWQSGGLERLVLGLALLIPLAVIAVAMGQLPTTGLAASPTAAATQSQATTLPKRPVVSDSGPPPTLVPPTSTPRPATTAEPAVGPATTQPTPTAMPRGAYTVRPGDELKGIAAQYGVSIFKIISANDIPNPDSLRVGQVLRIPEP